PPRPAARAAVAVLAGHRAVLGARHLAVLRAHLPAHRPHRAAGRPADPDVAAARAPLDPYRRAVDRGRHAPLTSTPPGRRGHSTPDGPSSGICGPGRRVADARAGGRYPCPEDAQAEALRLLWRHARRGAEAGYWGAHRGGPESGEGVFPPYPAHHTY